MGKNIPNSYDSSRGSHYSEKYGEHVDVRIYDEKGDMIDKKHISADNWKDRVSPDDDDQ